MKIPDFTLLQSCGRGAYGEVWLARSTLNGRLVALKIVMRSQAGEKELSGLINCAGLPDAEHIIRILHIGSIEDGFYYTMELADGLFSQGKFTPLTLAERLKQEKRLLPHDTALLGVALADGLQTLHDAGLLHRDVKPENILFVSGVPKLSDVGLIRLADQNTTIGGTLGFIPPDRLLAGMVSKDASDDLYALGKVLYCAVTGNSVEKFPDFPSGVLADPQGRRLNRIILKACDTGGRRYDSAGKLKEDLQTLLSSESGRKFRFRLGKKMLYGIFFLLLFCGIFANLYFLVQRKPEPAPVPVSAAGVFEHLNLNYAGGLTKWKELTLKRQPNGAFRYKPSGDDPLQDKRHPDELDMAPRRKTRILADATLYHSPNWDCHNLSYRPIAEAGQVLLKANLFSKSPELTEKKQYEEGTITLKQSLPDEFVIRFRIRWANQGAFFQFRISDEKDPSHSYSWSFVGGAKSPKNSLVEYQPSNDSDKIFFDMESYIGNYEFVSFLSDRIVTYEIVRTDRFLRIYSGAHLCTCIPSFFPGGKLSVELSQTGHTEISDFELFTIPHDPQCPRRLQYHLPIN